jgi:hypothetical protein
MINTPATAATRLLLRLPDDVASELARVVPTRQRNRFMVELLRRELGSPSKELVEACEYLNKIEAKNPHLVMEAQEWLAAELTESVDNWDTDFDQEKFLTQFTAAQAELKRK